MEFNSEKDILKFIKNDLKYNDGNLYWIKNNKPAGTLLSTGYRIIKYKDKRYVAHRLIWYYHYGYIPKVLDHVNRDKLDNRIENLRECNKSQNEANTGPRKTNKTGYKNVSFHKKANKYRAFLKGNHLGLFETAEQAALAYNQAAVKEYGEFAYLNEVK